MFATIFLDMKIPDEKSLLTLPVQSMLKITEIKNDMTNSKNKRHFARFLKSLNQLIIILVKYSIKL